MNSPEILIGLVSNLFSRMMHFKKVGDLEIGHTHQFDHLTLLAKGKLKIKVNNQVSYYQAPYMIFIHKDKIHELEAMEDDTVAYCIHALRTKDQSDILDPLMIPAGVENIFTEGIAGDIITDRKKEIKTPSNFVPRAFL